MRFHGEEAGKMSTFNAASVKRMSINLGPYQIIPKFKLRDYSGRRQIFIIQIT